MINYYGVKCDYAKIVMWWKPEKINEESTQTINILPMNLNAPVKL